MALARRKRGNCLLRSSAVSRISRDMDDADGWSVISWTLAFGDCRRMFIGVGAVGGVSGALLNVL